MQEPGEVTFFPVKHCRWCGLVEAADEFRVCNECAENPDYPDTSIFCSSKCETEAMKFVHLEEHARYLTIKCGLTK